MQRVNFKTDIAADSDIVENDVINEITYSTSNRPLTAGDLCISQLCQKILVFIWCLLPPKAPNKHQWLQMVTDDKFQKT